MPSGLNGVWLLTWSLWSVVVFLDWRREPRDWRWILSLTAMILVAFVTRDSLNELNLRAMLLSGLAVAVIAVWAWGRLRLRREARKLADWASRHDFTFLRTESQYVDSAIPEPLTRLPFLVRGSFARTSRLISRDDGLAAQTLVFESTVKNGGSWFGASGAESRATVVAIFRPGCDVPLFQIRPAASFAWVDGGPKAERVETTPSSRFALGYTMHGHEPRNLRAIFNEALLNSISEKAGWILQGEGRWLIAAYFDRSENLMSLKTSSLRSVGLTELADHILLAERLLNEVAASATRHPARAIHVA